jgi:hypothetical protein
MTEEHHMPISDELHELVGNPVPSTDLGQRARVRAGEIKRRRLAGITTSVVAVTVLAVPGALLVRDQSGGVNGAAGGGGSEPTPTASSAAGVPGVSTAALTTVVPNPAEWSAADKTRFAHALALLGRGFSQTGSGIVLDRAGKQLGVSARFTAADGGGIVDVQWLKAALAGDSGPKPIGVGTGVVPQASWVGPATVRVQASSGAVPAPGPGTPDKGAATATAAAPGAAASAVSVQLGTANLDPASGGVLQDSVGATGMVSSDGKLILNVMVTQGKAGSPAVLPGKTAAAFASALLTAG